MIRKTTMLLLPLALTLAIAACKPAEVAPPTAEGAAPASADDPVPHRVRYSVSSTETAQANVYYREVQPPNFGEYSHNPYQYSPRADVTIGPNQPWIFETTLADPQGRQGLMGAEGGDRHDGGHDQHHG